MNGWDEWKRAQLNLLYLQASGAFTNVPKDVIRHIQACITIDLQGPQVIQTSLIHRTYDTCVMICDLDYNLFWETVPDNPHEKPHRFSCCEYCLRPLENDYDAKCPVHGAEVGHAPDSLTFNDYTYIIPKFKFEKV